MLLHGLDTRDPHFKFAVRVVVPEAHAGWCTLQVPVPVVPTVEADERHTRRGRLEHRGHAALETLRGVNGHIRDVVRAEEGQRALGIAFIQPRPAPKRDRDWKPVHALLALLE